MAEKFARKLEGQLAAGTYENQSRKRWAEFRAEYEQRTMPGVTAGTHNLTTYTFNHFERIIKPVRVCSLSSRAIADYVAARTAETASKNGDRLSPATVNRELRNLRTIARRAHKWGYLPRVPEFEFLREPGKLPTYVTPEHFARLYQHADAARWPDDGPFEPTDWWRALLFTAYMTGWRIGSLLALRREDVEFETEFALSRATDNKGKRDERVRLHPLVLDHLQKLTSFSPLVFPWNHARRGLFAEFHAIQRAAEVRPAGAKRWYGFHDLRRAFATMNADRLTAEALQSLMQHRSYLTTRRYINMVRQLNPAVQSLFVPELPNVGAG